MLNAYNKNMGITNWLLYSGSRNNITMIRDMPLAKLNSDNPDQREFLRGNMILSLRLPKSQVGNNQ